MSSPSSSFSDFYESEPPSPSTAPSSPTRALEEAYFIVPSSVPAGFLKTLCLTPGSQDNVLLLSGQGTCADAFPLFSKARTLFGIPALNSGLWEAVKSEGGIDYYRTNVNSTLNDIPDFGKMALRGRTPSRAAMLNLFTDSRLRCVLTLQSGTMTLQVLERPAFTLPRLSLTPSHPIRNATGTPYGVPSLDEYRDLWKAWDLVTLGMIPQELLHTKPIDLRHKCLFYLGHIPTFVNILLSKYLKEPYTEPKNFTTIFERGIDPHVDDPDHCHNHSEVPERDEDWPVLEQILDYRDRVRQRLVTLYAELEAGTRPLTRRLGRTLMMILEHEGFHVETLLYMLIQRADGPSGRGMLPPPGFTTPCWEELVSEWAEITPPVSRSVNLGPGTLVVGHDDCETDDLLPEFERSVTGHEFGWDNESPKKEVRVGKFRVDWRPVTNAEFYEFWEANSGVDMPVSWVQEGGEIKVRTLYGPVPMHVARDWPVLTSYDDLSAYAKSKGGRIPNEYELRLFLDKYNVCYEEGANVGFRNWHPLPASAGGLELNGRGSNGGVWEWTSTLMEEHEGFAGTSIFAGYSSDFFDTKHHIVLGASYATIPRLSDRRTVRNFYQHNYPYPWVAARVAYDDA